MPRKFHRDVEHLISSLRGFPEEDLPLKDREAAPLDSLLESLIARYHIDRHTPEETIQENWVRIIGAPYAKRCHPERIDASGALLVQVANATLKRELMFHEDRMLTVIGSLTDCGHIRRVVFKGA
jgi:hypothetical protein